MANEKKLDEMTRLKQKIDKYRPLSKNLVQSLQNDYLVKNTYHSNAIEGNTLTMYETKAILEDGVTIAGKSMREHLEAINHKQAILLTENILKNKIELSERDIKDLHSIILHGIDRSNAGVYRNDNVIISGASHTPPDFLVVPQLMNELIDWYNNDNKLHPIQKAAILHSKFVNIHPFIDGNGRTSRLLMNLELMKSGYLPIIIENEKRANYYEVLDKAGVNDDYEPFIEFVEDYELQALNRYSKLIKRHQEIEGPEL